MLAVKKRSLVPQIFVAWSLVILTKVFAVFIRSSRQRLPNKWARATSINIVVKRCGPQTFSKASSYRLGR
jgi:hypothetical protein